MSERITYYTTPETIYDQDVDVVKGASLTGREVDMNFNTLEGRCIRKAEMDGSNLEITFMNGKSVTCDLAGAAAVTSLSFEYDREHGVLHVFVNGEGKPIDVKGFFSEREMREYRAMGVLTDGSVVGNGTMRHPLSVSRMLRPGMLRSVKDCVPELPTSGMAAGDRYVTTETVDTYGALYNYRGVLNIMSAIEGTGWRVAMKEDWDDMLNALEPEKADRNHHLHECNLYLGESANHYLADDSMNFNLVYCGYAYEEEDPHVVFNGSRAGWWTGTNDDGKNAWMKRVDDLVDGVFQDIVDGENFYSVRLVRDLEPGDMAGAEEIMGRTYMTTAMPSVRKGLRLWTATNFASDLVPITEEYTEIGTITECDGSQTTTETTVTDTIDDMSSNIYRPSEYPAGELASFVCEWDGNRWRRQRAPEYTAFYVEERGGFYYLVDNEPVSILDAIPADLEPRVSALEFRMDSADTEISRHNERITELEEVSDNHADVLEQLSRADEALGARVDDAMNMAITATSTAARAKNAVEEFEEMVARFESEIVIMRRLFGREFLDEYLKDAVAYRYDDYEYHGEVVYAGEGTVSYSLSADVYAYDPGALSEDLGRLLGAIYRSDRVNPLGYNGKLYEWDGLLGNDGSNYVYRRVGYEDVMLLDAILADFNEAHTADWTFQLGFYETPATFIIGLK